MSEKANWEKLLVQMLLLYWLRQWNKAFAGRFYSRTNMTIIYAVYRHRYLSSWMEKISSQILALPRSHLCNPEIVVVVANP